MDGNLRIYVRLRWFLSDDVAVWEGIGTSAMIVKRTVYIDEVESDWFRWSYTVCDPLSTLLLDQFGDVDLYVVCRQSQVLLPIEIVSGACEVLFVKSVQCRT